MEWAISGWSKGGLAWKLRWKGRRVVGDVVDHRGINSGLGVYRRKEGGRNNKYRANKCNTMHDKTISRARGVLTRCYAVPGKGENIREIFPEVWHFRIDEPEGDGCMFAMLGACDRWMESVFGFVIFFWATFMYKTFPSELRIIFYDFLKF